MFLYLLPDAEQATFLKVARLLSVSDNPLLWDGKTHEELTGETNLSNVTLAESPHERAIFDGFARECGKVYKSDGVSKDLLARLKALPLLRQSDPAERARVACEVLDTLVDDTLANAVQPSVPKVMLYELMLLALADGRISSVEEAQLRRLADMFGVDSVIYDDLLERAVSINAEASRTVAIILE